MKKDNSLGFVDPPQPIGWYVRYYLISIHLAGINPVRGMLTDGGLSSSPNASFFHPFPYSKLILPFSYLGRQLSALLVRVVKAAITDEQTVGQALPSNIIW